MESQIDMESAMVALMMQLDEGVDEWIHSEAVVRFRDPEIKAPVTLTAATKRVVPKAEPKVEQTVDFSDCADVAAVMARIEELLPPETSSFAQQPIERLGEEGADIAVIIDPPQGAGDRSGDLRQEIGMELLVKSLAAIEVKLDARDGQEPRPRFSFLPISPWRIPQDRKLVDHEAKILIAGLLARLENGGYKAVVFAGSNLGGVEKEIIEGKFGELPAFSVIPPKLLLREPLLKRRHWQMLLVLHAKLAEVLKI